MAGINGQEWQHATIAMVSSLFGPGTNYIFTTFSKAAYKDGAEKKPVLNSQGQIDGHTIDNQKTDGSVTLRMSEWTDFKRLYYAQGPIDSLGRTIGIGQFVFVWTFTFGNSLTALQTDRVTVMIQEDPVSSENNQEAEMVDLPLFVKKVEKDIYGPGNGQAFVNYPQF